MSRQPTPPIEDSIEDKLFSLLVRFEEYCDCEEYHIHNSDDPLVENTHSSDEWDAHKDFDLKEAKDELLALIESETSKARIDEAKRAANHNNSAYTSDYLEDRIIALYNQLKQTKEPKEDI